MRIVRIFRSYFSGKIAALLPALLTIRLFIQFYQLIAGKVCVVGRILQTVDKISTLKAFLCSFPLFLRQIRESLLNKAHHTALRVVLTIENLDLIIEEVVRYAVSGGVITRAQWHSLSADDNAHFIAAS